MIYKILGSLVRFCFIWSNLLHRFMVLIDVFFLQISLQFSGEKQFINPTTNPFIKQKSKLHRGCCFVLKFVISNWICKKFYLERNPRQISHSLTVLCFLQKIFRSRWRQSETELVVTTAYWIWTLSPQINFGMFRQTTNLVFWKHYCMEMWVNVPNVKYQIRYSRCGKSDYVNST